MATIDLVILAAYMVLILALGLYKARQVSTGEDYNVAGRNLGIAVLAGTLVMTEFNTTTMISYSAFGYQAGIYATMLPLGLMIGMWIYAFVFSRRWKRINADTISDFFEIRYGSSFRNFASILFIVSLVISSATYLKAAAKIFSLAIGLSEFWTAVILYAVVLAFTVLGGLVSVAWTDFASLLVALIGVPLLLYFAYGYGGGWEGLKETFPEKYLAWQTTDLLHDPVLPFTFILAIILGNVFNGQGYPWTAQRMFAARDERTAYVSMLLAACAVSVLYMMPIATSAFVRVRYPGIEDPEYAFGLAVINWLPIGVTGLVLAVVFAMAQTTVSSVWNTTSAMISNDVYRKMINPSATPEQMLRVGRWSTLGLAVFSFIVSLWFTRVLDGLYLSIIFRLCLNFAVWAGFLWYSTNRKAAWISTIVGLVAGLYFKTTMPGNAWITWMNLAGNGMLFAAGILATWMLVDGRDEKGIKVAFYKRVGLPWLGRARLRSAMAEVPVTGRPEAAGSQEGNRGR